MLCDKALSLRRLPQEGGRGLLMDGVGPLISSFGPRHLQGGLSCWLLVAFILGKTMSEIESAVEKKD